MIINCKEKFAVLEDFERTDCSSFIITDNRCNSMVHKRSTILKDTIAIFSVEIQLLESFKMIINCEGKFAVLEDFERPDRWGSVRKANRWKSIVYKISTILDNTIASFSVEI